VRRPVIGRLEPGASKAFHDALAALAACADVARGAGSSLASTYIAGAGGNLRHAMTALGGICDLATTADMGTFDVVRSGKSQLIGTAGRIDTIRDCAMPDGSAGIARALLTAPDPEDGVWLRADAALPGLVVRGTVLATERGMEFSDGAPHRAATPVRPAPDLACDLVRSAGIDLVGSAADAAAWELTLASGSWVHLETGSRWFADRSTARTVVRLMGGTPALTGWPVHRSVVQVDRDVLLAVEALGWRHWPTPSLEA
jgi:hypothetical protein